MPVDRTRDDKLEARRPRSEPDRRMARSLTSKRSLWRAEGLLFAVKIIERIRSKDGSLRTTDEPFFAIGIIARLTDWVVGYHVHYQVFISVIDQLVRLIWSKNEGVARFDRRLSTPVSRNSATGNDVIELPLRAVGVIRISRFSWRDPGNLDIERMPFH